MVYYCGNNELSHRLQTNGGRDVLGTHNACLKKGYARGFNQKPADVPQFVQNWLGAYKPHVVQRLWHSAERMPPGYQRATLNQSMQRGFAFGSIALAQKLNQKTTRAKTQSATKRPALPFPH